MNRYDGPIVDAHHHFWEPGRNPNPWLKPDASIPFRYGDYTAIKRDYLPNDYRRDATGHDIVQTVYVETEWDPNDPVGETAYAHRLAETHGRPNAIVAQAWLHHDDAATVLAAQARFPLVRSIRHKPGGPAAPTEPGRTLMSDPIWRRGYAMLAPNHLHFDLQTPWWNLHEAAELAHDFPETTIILNHAGLPAQRDTAGLQGWRAAMARLATRPNAVVKLSGMGVPGQPWLTESTEWIVREAIGLFGPARTMFGSNFPVDRLCAGFDEILSGFKSILAALPPEEQEAFFCTTARRVYTPVP